MKCILGLIMLWCAASTAFAQAGIDAFLELKGEHFIVRYLLPYEKDAARQVLARAEQCYDSAAHHLGFTRYGDFWTWDKRVKIILFPDQESYTRFTGQAQWSKAYATRNSKLFHARAVVTFIGQPEMNTSILPHEIAHLAFWDLLGRNYAKAPEWLEEGVAQLEEPGKTDRLLEALAPVVAVKKHIPFKELQKMRPSELKDEVNVALFYAESLSVVVFLIEKYGQEAFYRLSKEMRDGRDFEDALIRAYGSGNGSLDALEAQWVRYVSGK